MSNGWHRKVDNAATRERKRQYNSAEYKDRRKAEKANVDAGTAHCWRCGQWLRPGRPWHLGHDDSDRSIIRGTECPPCNLRAAARKGARVANARRRGGVTVKRGWQSRDW